MAEAATRHFSQSVETWQMRLQVLIQLKRDDVTQCFEEAIKRVKSKVCAALMGLHALVLGWKPLMIGCYGVFVLSFFVCLGFLLILFICLFWFDFVIFCLQGI